MLESPPISPKTVRHGKRSRQSSRGEVSVGEISPEDTGYDGDVEVVHPDEVEEPETESDNDDTELGLRRLLWPDADEELAAKMKRLGWKSKDRHPLDRTTLERPGARRLSKEADPIQLNQHGKRTEIEVSEMVEGQNQARHAKRRKEAKFDLAKRIIQGKFQAMSDTSEQPDGKPALVEESSVSTAPEVGGDEAMDLD